MKIYLSHNFAARFMLGNVVVPILEGAGHTIISRWVFLEGQEDAKTAAEADLEDIIEADVFLFWPEQIGATPGRGKYIELGYALALGKEILLITRGSDELLSGCVFYQLTNLMIPLKNIGEAIEFLKAKK